MGLLKVGHPLTWDASKPHLNYIRHHGVQQFLNTWRRVRGIKNDTLKYGDEIEVGIFVIDKATGKLRIALRSHEIQELLRGKESESSGSESQCTWQPEYGAWMIESTPSAPYGQFTTDLVRVEKNLITRRRRLLWALHPDEVAPTITCFPLFGRGDFVSTTEPFAAPHSQSVFVPDIVINSHPRFATLTSNIRSRRGRKVDIRIPLYRDERTPEFDPALREAYAAPGDGEGVQLEPDTDIHMDCMAFGMGMCCLQVTFQARDCDESRYMYDQLAVLAPIMLAMTAATPVLKGRLSGNDVRWSVIAQSVDDRTAAELGEVEGSDIAAHRDATMAGEGVRRIDKSRYGSISTYIYHCPGHKPKKRSFELFNDIPCEIDEDIKDVLLDEGIDVNLAHHIAHLFIRDPLVVFSESIEVDDAATTEHFESIQSTNWQTCRWKPPPPRVDEKAPHIGWRTEFRPMEVQLTDFENAAFTVFTILITRVILAFDLALYIPLSKVDENMRRAHLVDAARQQKFFFRKFIAPPDLQNPAVAKFCDQDRPAAAPSECDPSAPWVCGLAYEDSFEEMSIDEIFNGKDCYFPGLIPLVYGYLEFVNCDAETFEKLDKYLTFISNRAKGTLVTNAVWMRNFVESHPSYRRDSVVTNEIAADLVTACAAIGEGARACPEVLGNNRIDRIRREDAYGRPLAGRLGCSEKADLVRTMISRALSGQPLTRENSVSGQAGKSADSSSAPSPSG